MTQNSKNVSLQLFSIASLALLGKLCIIQFSRDSPLEIRGIEWIIYVALLVGLYYYLTPISSSSEKIGMLRYFDMLVICFVILIFSLMFTTVTYLSSISWVSLNPTLIIISQKILPYLIYGNVACIAALAFQTGYMFMGKPYKRKFAPSIFSKRMYISTEAKENIDVDTLVSMSVEYALSHANKKGEILDFSPESVRKVEKILHCLSSEKGGLRHSEIIVLSHAYACYLGEIVKRSVSNASWIMTSPSIATGSLVIRIGEKTYSFSETVRKTILHGSPLNISLFVQLMIHTSSSRVLFETADDEVIG